MRKFVLLLIPFLFLVCSCNQILDDVINSADIVSAEWVNSSHDALYVNLSKSAGNTKVRIEVYDNNNVYQSRNDYRESTQTYNVFNDSHRVKVYLTKAIPSGWKVVVLPADGNEDLYGSCTLFS